MSNCVCVCVYLCVWVIPLAPWLEQKPVSSLLCFRTQRVLLTFSGLCFVMELESPDWSVLNSQTPDKYPVIEIAFRNGLWWQLPKWMSNQLLGKYQANEQDIGYTWDWGDARNGSWRPDDETTTSINRYLLNFETWEQTNIDNQRKRTFRIAWVDVTHQQPVKTGEIASCS
jgi:hypothetical protein